MPDLKRTLPNWIDAFMLYTENTEPPIMFRKWSAISAIASALMRKVRVDWGPSLTFYPNLYVILVGKSATGKGTAMNPALDIMHEIPLIKLSANATSLQALIRHLKDTNLNDLDMDTGKQQMHSSLTIFSKEFTVFLGYHNRELMAALCDWYDCDRRWSYETISRKKEEIIGVWVNLFGATTPDLIQSSLPMDSIGGGLTSRIIFINEESPAKLVPLPTATAREAQLKELLIRDLEKITMLAGQYRWTQGFSELWVDWCYRCRDNPPFYNPKFDGYIGRRRGHTMKLAMVASAAHGRNDLILTRDDLQTAIEWVIEAEAKMERVFKGVGKSDISQLINQAITFITSSESKEVPIWQFARHFSDDMDKFSMDRVLTTLRTMKLIDIGRKEDGTAVISILDEDD
jgi:hypothetical protein